MSNSLFSMLGGNQNSQMAQMLNQFQQFKNTLNGDPKQMVMQMLNQGKITQADLNNAQAFAQQFKQFLK